MKCFPIHIGMNTLKSVFQLHGVDAGEFVVVYRALRRAQMVHYFEKLPTGTRRALWRRAE